MPLWSNSALTVYHGTDRASASAFGVFGGPPLAVSLALCTPFTDFGQGFYTTTRLHQARQWSNLKAIRAASTAAVVVAFDLDRDWLGGLDTLAFVRATRDFWNLVTDCRSGFSPHQRRTPYPLPYDVVYGPVTLWPQTLVIGDCDQIGFHTTRAITGLGHARFVAQGGSTKGLF